MRFYFYRLSLAQAILNPIEVGIGRVAALALLGWGIAFGVEPPGLRSVWLSIAVVGALAWLALFRSLREWRGSRTVGIDADHLVPSEAEHDPRRRAGRVPIAWLCVGPGLAGTVRIRAESGHFLVLPHATYIDLQRAGMDNWPQRLGGIAARTCSFAGGRSLLTNQDAPEDGTPDDHGKDQASLLRLIAPAAAFRGRKHRICTRASEVPGNLIKPTHDLRLRLLVTSVNAPRAGLIARSERFDAPSAHVMPALRVGDVAQPAASAENRSVWKVTA